MSDWEDYEPSREVTSAFVSYSVDFKDWISKIQDFFGWNVKEIGQDPDGNYVVQGEDPVTGETTETTDPDLSRALSFLFSRINRSVSARPVMASGSILEKFAAWDRSFVDRVEEVAHEYADAKIYDKKAASAWMEFANDNKRRADMIRKQLSVEVTDHPLPYKTFDDMVSDVIEKKKFAVSRADADHPIWTKDQVVNFRIVHDVLGHVASGADWSWFGMNKAFASHAPLLSLNSQKALFTETLGKGAFNSYYRSMAQDKIVFLKCFDEQQEIENRPGHRETHPSQSPAPTEIPKFASVDSMIDPNYGWESGIEPDRYNAYITHRIHDESGNIVDPLNTPKMNELAHEIDPRFNQHTDDAYLNQAVSNAFRTSLTGTGRSDQHHAMIYQAINHIPADVTDPLKYNDAINADRNAHNMARGYNQVGKELDSFMPFVMQSIQNINPHLVGEDLHTEAREMLLDMQAEEENEVKDSLGPEATAEDIYAEAMRRMKKRLNAVTKANVKDDQDFRTVANQDASLYPCPLASQIKPLAEIAKHLDDIADAAKQDLHTGGRGHHFRASVLKKSIEGLDPDKISEAWFYLAPHTSQLGVLTPSLIKSLGHKPQDLESRDYFKAERQLQAGRDGSGYNHMPLGQFSHALHNVMHYEEGHHPGKSHVHSINPTKHHHVDWSRSRTPSVKPFSPNWWVETKPQRNQVGKDWDRQEGIKHPKNAIPYKQADAAFTPAFSFAPFFLHPQNNNKIVGQPGQNNMQHVLESMALQDQGPQAVWNQDLELGKEAIGNGV